MIPDTAAPILLAYAFERPVPGTEIVAMLRAAELASFGAVGEEAGAPPLRASCGERHGMAFWSFDGGWRVGDGRAVAAGAAAAAARLASGERMELTGALDELRLDRGWAWADHPGALRAFAGASPGEPVPATVPIVVRTIAGAVNVARGLG